MKRPLCSWIGRLGIFKMTIVYKLESLFIKFWIEINYVKFEQFPQIFPLIVIAWAWKI